MKKLMQSQKWLYEMLMAAVIIMSVMAGLMRVTVDVVYAAESAAEEVPQKEYLKPTNLPDDTDYVLVIDKSGSLWAQEYGGETGVFEKIRNSASQAFLRVAAGTNNRIAVVYFDKSADSEENGCLLTDVNSDAGFDTLLRKLNYTVPSGMTKTQENASTNIAAGLEKACDILDTAGSTERKKCIILFSDGFNDLYMNGTEYDAKTIEKFRKDTKDKIFGSEDNPDDGLTTRIRDSKYELYCIYLENVESQEKEAQSKKLLENLVDACRMDGETDAVQKFYYVSGALDEKSKYFDLAKQFSEVFYVSQDNSRHQELVMQSDEGPQRSQIYVPNAAVSQLNLFLVNVPETSQPVLRNVLSGTEYTFERDVNEPEMVYYNIDDPEYGDYELLIPDSVDARGAYAYYTDLRATIDIEKTNGFGTFPIGLFSRVRTSCSFFDSEGNPYDFMDNEHFKMNVSLSREGEEAVEIPMRWNGNCWETIEDIRLKVTGIYNLIAKASLDNETINTLEYVKQIGNINSMDVWVWIYAFVAVLVLIVLGNLYVWARRKSLQSKIVNTKSAIEKEKNTAEKKYKEVNSKKREREETINNYEEAFDYITDQQTQKFKMLKSKLLLKELGIWDLLNEQKDYSATYKNAETEYVNSYDAVINKASECNDVDFDKKDSVKVLTNKYRQLFSCLEEVKKLKQEAETKAQTLEELAEEAKMKYVLLDKAIEKIKEMLDQEINCDIRIDWPSQDRRYRLYAPAEDFEYGIEQLDDLVVTSLSPKLEDVPFKEAIEYETNIIILPYQSESGRDGIELKSDKDFGIRDLNGNTVVKSCEPIDPKQPDGEKKYVARLEEGRYSLNLHTDDGLGALTLTLNKMG